MGAIYGVHIPLHTQRCPIKWDVSLKVGKLQPTPGTQLTNWGQNPQMARCTVQQAGGSGLF